MSAKRNLIVYILLTLTAAAAFSGNRFRDRPLAIEPNRGQFGGEALFGARTAELSIAFSRSNVRYQRHGVELTMRWLGTAKPGQTQQGFTALDVLPGTVNYFVGRDPARWISGLPTYGRLAMPNLYPGVDLIYYRPDATSSVPQLEYDLIVAPHADPAAIAIAFDGGTPVLDADGNVVIRTSDGDFVQHRPVAYQDVDGKRQAIAASYRVNEQGEVRVALGKYDTGLPLVIDPAIAWARTLGVETGVGSATANAVATDGAGNVFVTGATSDPAFPVVNAYKGTMTNSGDAFLTKFSPAGSVLFSTYYGGSNDDRAAGVAVDGAGNAYITGFTRSADLGTRNPYQAALHGNSDAFVAKFSPTGSLLYGTYLGGTSYDGGVGIAVDAAANIYILGQTGSNDFPIVNPYQASLKTFGPNCFVSKLSADGEALVFSTYFGGSIEDDPAAIALGPGNSIYITGATTSRDFPTTANALQTSLGGRSAFVTRFAASGSTLIYSTLFSGLNQDLASGWGIDVDVAGAAYVAGHVFGQIPVKDAVQNSSAGGDDAFLAKFAADGTLVYSTYLGGSSGDAAKAVRVDGAGNATVVGYTDSNDFPTVAAAVPAAWPESAFVTQINAAGNGILYSTFVRAGQAFGLALDAGGNVYVAGQDYTAPFLVKLAGAVEAIPVTFNTVPSGLQVVVDGVTIKAPVTLQWAAGVSHTLDVPVPQLVGSNVSNFLSWSNGGAKSQTVTTPAAATTFTATFDSKGCTFSFPTPASTTVGQAGLLGASLQVITQPGCTWTPVSNAPWITFFPNFYPGPGALSYSIAANTASGTRTGTITVGSATFTVTQTYSVPTISYTITNTGPTRSGLSNVFVYNVDDQDGYGDLTITNILINSALDGRSACYLAFDHVNRIIYLVDDSGTSITGIPLDAAGHGKGSLSNSQCTVDGPNSSIFSNTGAPTLSVVSLAVAFKPSFGGMKVVYVAARDKEGSNSGWSPIGIFNVTNNPGQVTLPGVTYGLADSYAAGNTILSVNYDGAAGTTLKPSQILVNTAVDGRNACYMGYDFPNNLLYLVNDAGDGLLPAITPGVGNGTQQNSQCIIYAQGSSAYGQPNEYTLNANVQFLPAFQGRKVMYVATQDTAGANTGWLTVNAFLIYPNGTTVY